jgi:hypothetical protein
MFLRNMWPGGGRSPNGYRNAGGGVDKAPDQDKGPRFRRFRTGLS